MTIDQYCNHDVAFEKDRHNKEHEAICLYCDHSVNIDGYHEKEGLYVLLKGGKALVEYQNFRTVVHDMKRLYIRNIEKVSSDGRFI